MKKRIGFVSNSSSSSFIISTDAFPTVRDLAKYMIKRQIESAEYDDDPEEYINCLNERIERLNNVNENHPISFPSCNYDTYIKKAGDCYLVSTCNNEDWGLYHYDTKLTENSKEFLNELKNKYNKNSRDYQIIQDLLINESDELDSIDKDYYDLNANIIGVEMFGEYCKNHKGEFINMWDTLYGKVCLICNPIFKRKDKLNIINNISNENIIQK